MRQVHIQEVTSSMVILGEEQVVTLQPLRLFNLIAYP